MTAEQQRIEVLRNLELAVSSFCGELPRAAIMSSGISLKRIADALEAIEARVVRPNDPGRE